MTARMVGVPSEKRVAKGGLSMQARKRCVSAVNNFAIRHVHQLYIPQKGCFTSGINVSRGGVPGLTEARNVDEAAEEREMRVMFGGVPGNRASPIPRELV